MADFIAVIRRAVDGLSENTPEMRAKVYERAKAAVVRQLENMKPRPPEAMFQRQIDKLDAAIREVESEHAVALPADDTGIPDEPMPDGEAPAAELPVAQPVADVPADAPVAAEPVAVEAVPVVTAPPVIEPAPAPVLEPMPAARQEFVPETEDQAAAHRELISESALQTFGQILRVEPAKSAVADELPKTQAIEPAPEPIRVPEALAEVEPETDIPAYATSDTVIDEPVARLEPETHPAQLETATYAVAGEAHGADDHIAEVLGDAKAFATPGGTVYQPFPPVAAPAIEARREPVAAPAVSERPAEVALGDIRPTRTDHAAARVAAPDADEDRTAAPMPRVSYDESDVVEGFNDFLKQELNRQVVPPPPGRAKSKGDFSWDEPFDDLPDIPKPEAFEKALEAKQQEIEAAPAPRRNKAGRPEPVSARAELEDLLGLEPSQRKPNTVNADAGPPPNPGRGASRLEGKAFKTQARNKKAKRRSRMMAIALGVVGVLVVAGGAYGVWAYRDKVGSVFSGLMPASETGKSIDTAQRDATTDGKAPATKSADASTDTKPAVKNKEVASLDTDANSQKFTQRLMPDGTETATDTAKVPVDQALPEGKTVATQNEKSKEEAAAAPMDAKTDTGNTTQPQSDNQVRNDAQPLGATQKMFLYEERLGQASPVAVPGTVVWREKSGSEDGKPDPAIEASLDVPGRKITALLTFKRNTDSSLPASHIIEIVFDLPKDFEEGNVDSIQRIAFKQTEQDRGNPLIAVPAKITDDFHMVALNDDADARKVNLELMKTRSWIDIPITYRNGRRALITIEKGATGTAVFDKVMGEWDAIGSQTSTNQ